MDQLITCLTTFQYLLMELITMEYNEYILSITPTLKMQITNKIMYYEEVEKHIAYKKLIEAKKKDINQLKYQIMNRVNNIMKDITMHMINSKIVNLIPCMNDCIFKYYKFLKHIPSTIELPSCITELKDIEIEWNNIINQEND